MDGMTASVAGFCHEMATSTLPVPVADTVRLGFTDCIAVLVAGWNEPVARLVRDLDPPRDRSDAAAYAVAYGTAAHALDYDDVAFGCHPSAVLVPALLAASHDRPISGSQAMRAYAAGYEIWAELAGRDQDPLHAKGWHPTSVYGPVAAAASVASARSLSAEQIAASIGVASSLSGGLVANFGSMTKPFQVGRAVQSGLVAVRAAEAGMNASADALENERGFLMALSPRGLVDLSPPANLAALTHISEQGLTIKLQPICFAGHRLVDAALELRSRRTIAADAVERIVVELGDTQSAMLRDHAPQTIHGAKFSAEFAVAATLLRGQCGAAELEPDFIRSDAVQALMARVVRQKLTARDAVEKMHSPFDRVTIHFADGTVMASSAVRYPEGHNRRPATAERLRQKFDACVVPSLGVEAADRLYALLNGLDSLSDIGLIAAAATAETL
jgi:2-methylcitrate dehydratase PrpD